MTVLTAAQSFLSQAVARDVVRRALRIALIVGPLLTVINQFEAITAFSGLNLWKMGLTFLVPYGVSTYSSVLAKRQQRRHEE